MKTGVRTAVSLLVLLALLSAACGGGAAGTSSTVDTGEDETTTQPGAADTTTTTLQATTTAEATTSTPASGGVGIDDIPPDCLTALSGFLQSFEPAVEAIDWTNATIDDHLQVMMAMATASVGDMSACEGVELDVSDEEGAALFFAVAEQEAPGAVGYFTAILAMTEALEGRESTGDCQTDIGLFEEVVAGGVPWVDLPIHEQWYVMNLMSSIGFCNLQTQGELRFRPEVEEFLAGSPFSEG
jgi:hypothetical protein